MTTAVDAERHVPIGIFFEDGRWYVDWCRPGALRFTDPFFEQTVLRCLFRPANLAFRRVTHLDALPEVDPEALAPSGFIFHLSRCGSTLIAQSLAASRETLVISEASPIDQVVRLRRYEPQAREAERVRRLRAIVSALGRLHVGTERNFVIKLDAWHALELDLFARAFPDVPWVFVYRDPVEILVSQARSMGWFLAIHQAPSLLGMPVADAFALERSEYRARVLGAICDAVLAHGVTADALVAYDDLPGAIEGRIARRFGLSLSDDARAALRTSFTRDAKTPERPFAPDGVDKRAEATDDMRAAVARHLARPYAALEAIRRAPLTPSP